VSRVSKSARDPLGGLRITSAADRRARCLWAAVSGASEGRRPPFAQWLGALVVVWVSSIWACARPPDPGLEAEGNYVAAQVAFARGDYASAHRSFAEVRRLRPADPRLPAAEGEVYLAELNVDRALASFEEAVAKEPQRATGWSRLGFLYSLKRQPDKARRALETALAKDPKDFNALEVQADLSIDEGDVDAGVERLARASQLAPERSKGPLILKAAKELEKRKRPAEALEVLERAIASGVTAPEVMDELGDALIIAGRLPEAVKAYTSAAERNRSDPGLWELVGETELALGHLPEAKAAFAKSLEIEDRGSVHLAMARLCQAAKDEPCVKAEADRAVMTITGFEVREVIDLADVLATIGRAREAVALLRAVSEEPAQKANSEIQLKTARLAAGLKDITTVKAACARALAATKPGVKCP
jgi:tetratricopeptide (TPR) repeat protein